MRALQSQMASLSEKYMRMEKEEGREHTVGDSAVRPSADGGFHHDAAQTKISDLQHMEGD